MVMMMMIIMIMIMMMIMIMKQLRKNFVDGIYNTFVVPLENFSIVSFDCSRM